MQSSRKKAYLRMSLTHATILPSLLVSLLSCSGLKLDKDTNCLNQNSGCFKPDKTAPKFTQAMPDPNQSVNALTTVDLIFSEEPKDGDNISHYTLDKSGGAVNMQLLSVEKVNGNTYRLRFGGSVNNGPITIGFAALKDYGGNPMSNPTSVTYTGNVTMSVSITVDNNRQGVSPSGYPNVAMHFSHNYFTDASNNWDIRSVPGSVADCALGTSINSGSGLAHSTTIDQTILQASFANGANTIVVCVKNAINPAAQAVGYWPILKPTATFNWSISPPNNSKFRDPVSIDVTCTPNKDKIIVMTETQQTTSPPDPGPPSFNADGSINTGSLYTSGLMANNPANPTFSKFRFSCIDIAGRVSTPPLATYTYYVDNTIPAVNLLADPNFHDFISSVGGSFNTTTLRFSTDQTSKTYNIRKGGTTCDLGGDGTLITFGTTDATPGNPTSVTLDTFSANHFTTTNTTYDVRICVAGTGVAWGMAYLSIVRDDNIPTMTPTVIGGSYGVVQNVVFTCDDNASVMGYESTELAGLAVPTVPTGPTYSAGAFQAPGQAFTGTFTPKDAYTTIVRYMCVDKAGNKSAIGQQQYTIDSTLPNVAFVSNERTSLSNNAGAYTTSQLVWNSTRAGLPYEIRRSGNCNGGPGGDAANTILSGTTPAAVNGVYPNVISSLTAAMFPTNGVTYNVKICVFNFVNQPSYQPTAISILKDSVYPTFAGLTAISSPSSGNFTISWNAATDAASGPAYYNIYMATAAGGPYNTVSYTAAHPATSINVTVPNPALTYYFIGGSVDIAGNETKVTAVELASKPTITLVVAGLDTANSKTFNLTDGTASTTVTANGSSTWLTTIGINGTYSFRITTQPTEQVCGIRQKQFGSLVSDLTLNVDCTDGFIVSGTFQKKPAAPLDYRLYRGKTSTIASNTTSGFGTLTPGGLAFSGNGTLYISEVSTNRIMRVNQGTGAVTNSSGDGTAGTVDGTSPNARFYNPSFMVSDGSNLYVSQVGTGLGSDAQDAIRKVDGIGTVTTLVTSTNANDPEGIVISGDLVYWANRATHQIKSFNITTGAIAIVAGTGGAGTTDGAAASATFNQPFGLAIIANKIYVTDFGSHRIRVVDLGTSTVSTLSGGTAGFQDGPTSSARFNAPGGIVTDGRDLYIAEYTGARLRKIRLDRTGGTNHIVSTLAGEGVQATGSTGTGANTRFNGIVVLATDGRSIFASDEVDSKIRKITDEGVVGYWPLDGTPIDHSSDGAGSFDLTLSTATTNVTGRYGGSDLAYRFSGFSLSTPDQNQFDVSTNYSISAWIYPNATGGMRIVDKITAGSCDGFLLDTLGTSNKLRFSYCFGANHLISGAAAPVNEWTHVTVTFSSAERRARIYFNGRLDAEADTGAGTTPVNALPLRIGIDSTGSNIFSGAMAGVRLYNRALTDAEVADLAQDANSTVTGSPFNTDPTGLLAHYTFNGGSPALAAGPVGNNLGAVGTPQIGVHGDSSGSSFVGAIDVNASAPGLPISNNPRTLCLWYNPQSVQSNRVLLMHGSNTINQAFGITFTSNTQLQFFNWNGPNVIFNYSSQLRSWHHLCGTLTGTTVEMFVNGVSIGTNTGTIGAINTQTNGGIQIGSSVDGNNGLRFNGYVDDVRIYNSVLSAAQIRRLAAAVPAGLVARLDYDGGTTDSSGYNHTVVNNGATPSDDRYSANNRAYKFNGTSESMTLNAGARMASDATFALWINPSTIPGSLAGLFDNWNGDGSAAGATGGGIVFNGPTGFRIMARGNGAINDCLANWMPPTGAYRHIAATIRSGAPGNISVYVDGSLITSCNPANFQPAFNNGINFSIGSNGWAAGLDGNIDDVRLYNRALSAAEVRALVQQPNKKIYLTAVSYGGNLGGVSGADTKCNFAGDGNKPAGGPWKAMLVNTNTSVVRRACTTANCITSGVAESVDWVLRPNITYMLSNNAAPIMTTNWNGVFDFVTGANNNNSTGLNTFTNAINGTPGATAWTGMTSDWYPDIAQCGDWNNNVALLGGPWPNKGVYGQSDLTNQPNGATPGAVYAGWGDNLCGSMLNRLYCVEQ